MKFFTILFILLAGLFTISWISKKFYPTKHFTRGRIDRSIQKPSTALSVKLKDKAAEALAFVNSNSYNTENCFLIDMSQPSGSNRFYIYDFKKDTIQNAGLVAHGNCFEYWLEGRRYSNVVGSGCTSLGKYKVGTSYTGKWGYSYKLHGLEKTNNNAFERTVVLHSHSCVPESETADEICQSNGCPTVAPGFLKDLKFIINTSRKPVLLWIYE